MGIELIVKSVVALYGFSVIVCILYLGYRGIYFNEDVFDSIAEVIKVAVVPVVTFVIGFALKPSRSRVIYTPARLPPSSPTAIQTSISF